MSKAGRFIVFEGGEGTGKDTKIELLKKEWPDAVYTKEPGGTKFGLEMRRLLLEWKDGEIDPLAELFFFSAARVHFMKEVVRPALAAGKKVVTNRFALSTIAYQVYGRERLDLLPIAREAIKASVGETMPDFTILFDLDPAEGIRRVEQRDDGKTRFDAESLAFHTRVREGYLKHVADFGPHAVIDAGGSIEEVWNKTKKALKAHKMLASSRYL
jgi:dTMP kinase